MKNFWIDAVANFGMSTLFSVFALVNRSCIEKTEVKNGENESRRIWRKSRCTSLATSEAYKAQAILVFLVCDIGGNKHSLTYELVIIRTALFCKRNCLVCLFHKVRH